MTDAEISDQLHSLPCSPDCAARKVDQTWCHTDTDFCSDGCSDNHWSHFYFHFFFRAPHSLRSTLHHIAILPELITVIWYSQDPNHMVHDWRSHSCRNFTISTVSKTVMLLLRSPKRPYLDPIYESLPREATSDFANINIFWCLNRGLRVEAGKMIGL